MVNLLTQEFLPNKPKNLIKVTILRIFCNYNIRLSFVYNLSTEDCWFYETFRFNDNVVFLYKLYKKKTLAYRGIVDILYNSSFFTLSVTYPGFFCVYRFLKAPVLLVYRYLCLYCASTGIPVSKSHWICHWLYYVSKT